MQWKRRRKHTLVVTFNPFIYFAVNPRKRKTANKINRRQLVFFHMATADVSRRHIGVSSEGRRQRSWPSRAGGLRYVWIPPREQSSQSGLQSADRRQPTCTKTQVTHTDLDLDWPPPTPRLLQPHLESCHFDPNTTQTGERGWHLSLSVGQQGEFTHLHMKR